MFINALVVLFCAIITICFGLLAKVINPIKLMTSASLGIVLYSLPFFFLIQSKSFYIFLFAELTLILLSQLFVAPAFAVISQLFPYTVRYRGVALGNCLGLAIFGGFTPYISSFLVQHTKLLWSPAIYLFTISLLGWLCSCSIKKKLFRVQLIKGLLCA